MAWVKQGATCRNCGAYIFGKFSANGRCNACHQYWIKKGKERPPEYNETKTHKRHYKARFCAICGGYHYAKNRCRACYYYWKKHDGEERPRDLWRPDCKVCARPLAYKGNRPNSRVGGRCRMCYQYYIENGVDRPEEMILAFAPLGYCDCGEPATTEKQVEMLTARTAIQDTNHGTRLVDLLLCQICLSELLDQLGRQFSGVT